MKSFKLITDKDLHEEGYAIVIILNLDVIDILVTVGKMPRDRKSQSPSILHIRCIIVVLSLNMCFE